MTVETRSLPASSTRDTTASDDLARAAASGSVGEGYPPPAFNRAIDWLVRDVIDRPTVAGVAAVIVWLLIVATYLVG